jgi:hypothetical protein
MAKGLGPPGVVKVSALRADQAKAGSWYFGCDCLVCKKRFALLDAWDGTTPIDLRGLGAILSSCLHCGEERMYRADKLVRYRQT